MKNSTQQYIFDFPTNEKLNRDNFIIADCNRDAFDILQKCADWPLPFFAIHGAAKSGKTHLMKAWAQSHCVTNLAFSDLTEIDETLPKETYLWLDDDPADDEIIPEPYQESLFHLYNRIMLKQHQGLIITSITPPAKWQITIPDLASRLKSLPSATLGMPNDELLAKLFHKLCADRQIYIADNIIAFLLTRMERSFAACYDLCDRLNHYSLTRKGKITLKIAHTCLDEYDNKD